MQDYYNTIPMYGIGGLIAKIAKAAGRAKIQGHANLLSKEQPELSKLLSKLAKSQKGGPKLSDKEAEKLATLAQDYRRSNIHYQNRRNKINEQIAAKRNPTPKPTEVQTEQTATQSARSPYLKGSNLSYTVPPSPRASKIRNARNKKAAQQNQAQNQAQGNPSREVASANPVKGTTLSSRWQQAKTWMNNHPKTTIGVPLLALGTGPGRYVTGNAMKAIQSNPESWFGNSVPASEAASDFIMMPDGTKIPIKRSAEGYFVPVNQSDNQTPPVKGDNIDQTLAGITNESLDAAATSNVANTLPSDPSSNISVSDQSQQRINDLFDDDQW